MPTASLNRATAGLEKAALEFTEAATRGANLSNAFTVGLKEIWSHKWRSLLTMLGIILGVSSLVAMNALVQGMENGMKEAFVAVGGLQKIRIESQPLPVELRHLRDFVTGLTIRDVHALQASAPEVVKVSPEMRLDSSPTLGANGKTWRNFMTAGVWPVQVEMMEHRLAHGRMFNEIDEEQARDVCVIGTGIRDELFGKPEDTGEPVIPIGQRLTVNGYPLTIIGMFDHYEGEQERKVRQQLEAEQARLRATGQTNNLTGPHRSRGWSGSNRRGGWAFWVKNNTVYMPLNTMWLKLRSGLTNSPPEPRLSSMEIRIRDVEQMDLALTQIRNVMMVNHRGLEDFSFRTQEDWAETIKSSIRNARVSGGIIAGISLLVGGIGIMNIMLASISERVREIGIRKAVGAGGLDIFTQIIVESSVIALVGGLAGLLVSRGVIWGISEITPSDNSPVVTLNSMLLAFGASVTIGVLAGLFPAFKAGRMNVIQALRYD
jgi:putative ABC transport system permease protein